MNLFQQFTNNVIEFLKYIYVNKLYSIPTEISTSL